MPAGYCNRLSNLKLEHGRPHFRPTDRGHIVGDLKWRYMRQQYANYYSGRGHVTGEFHLPGTHNINLPYKIKTQYVQISNIIDTSIKRPISGQSI